jgi:hypothetical protein
MIHAIRANVVRNRACAIKGELRHRAGQGCEQNAHRSHRGEIQCPGQQEQRSGAVDGRMQQTLDHDDQRAGGPRVGDLPDQTHRECAA